MTITLAIISALLAIAIFLAGIDIGRRSGFRKGIDYAIISFATLLLSELEAENIIIRHDTFNDELQQLLTELRRSQGNERGLQRP